MDYTNYNPIPSYNLYSSYDPIPNYDHNVGPIPIHNYGNLSSTKDSSSRNSSMGHTSRS